VTTEALAELFPDDPPLFLARIPHGYHDPGAILTQLEGAGFTAVAIDTVAMTSALPAAHHLAKGFCQGSPLQSEIEARRPGGLAAVTDAVTAAIAARLGPGPIAGGMQAHVVTAAG
jgi:hypothetical protein